MARQPTAKISGPIAVVGLGRFGASLALTLMEMGEEVLAIDRSQVLVQSYAGRLTHVVEADATNVEALAQLGLGEFHRAVVAIGNDIEASILSTAALVDLDIDDIWGKAITESHGRILERVGAHHVVFPEHDMGRRVAHVVGGRMLDFIALDENFALVETTPPPEVIGRTLADANIRQRYGVTVVCVKPQGQSFTYATPDTVVDSGDILVVAGETGQCEAFAERSSNLATRDTELEAPSVALGRPAANAPRHTPER